MEGYKLLIVDDKLENLDAARNYLKSSAHEVTYISDPQKAILEIDTSIKNKEYYDFGLFDLEMPDDSGNRTAKSGFELSRYAFQNGLYNMIITARESLSPEGGYGHKIYGNVRGSLYSGVDSRVLSSDSDCIRAGKADPTVWEDIFNSHLAKTLFGPYKTIRIIHEMQKRGKIMDFWDSMVKSIVRTEMQNKDSLIRDIIGDYDLS